jgi:hypothetical protein
VCLLVSVALSLVRDPAERAAIGHAHAHWLAGPWHFRREQGCLGNDGAYFGQQGFLCSAVEVARQQMDSIRQNKHLRNLQAKG